MFYHQSLLSRKVLYFLFFCVMTLQIICITLFLPGSIAGAKAQLYDDCILVLGDSVAAGTAVLEVPGYGYPVIQTESFSQVLDMYLSQQNVHHLSIYDVSREAAQLRPDGSEQINYFTSSAFQFAKTKACQFAVILPWMNNLPFTTDPADVDLSLLYLSRLVAQLQTSNPDTVIIIMGYYYVSQTDLNQRIYKTKISVPVIKAMNERLFAECRAGGAFADFPTISCLPVDQILQPAETFVLQSISQTDFYESDYQLTNASHRSWLDTFWNQFPGTAVSADSIHLSYAGKQRLASHLYGHMNTIAPQSMDFVLPDS